MEIDIIKIGYYAFIVLNFVYVLYLVYWLWTLRKRKMRSLRYSYFLLSLTIILIIFIPLLELFKTLPGWPWELIEMISLFLFLVSLNLVLRKIEESIYAYEELTRIIHKREE